MTDSFAVELPLPPKDLSPNVRKHWAAKARATKKYRTACAWAFTAAKPKGWKQRPIVIDVGYRCSANAPGYVAHDSQNAIASLKAAADGIVDAGIIPTDSHDWLEWGGVSLVTRKDDPAWKLLGDGVTVTVRVLSGG